MKECPTCEGYGDCWSCDEQDPECTVCDGTSDCPRCLGLGDISDASETTPALSQILGEALKESSE